MPQNRKKERRNKRDHAEGHHDHDGFDENASEQLDRLEAHAAQSAPRSVPVLASKPGPKGSKPKGPKPPPKGCNKPTTAVAVNGTPSGVAIASTSAQALEGGSTAADGQAVTPDNWEDAIPEDASKDVCAEALKNDVSRIQTPFVNVGAGGIIRYSGEQSVHHLNPLVLPSDVVRESFTPFARVIMDHKRGALDTHCKHTLAECDCFSRASEHAPEIFNDFVFSQSIYYMDEVDLSNLPTGARMYILADLSHSNGAEVLRVEPQGRTYAHPDASWILKPRKVGGRFYIPDVRKQIKTKDGLRVYVRATITAHSHGIPLKADPAPVPRKGPDPTKPPPECSCWTLLKRLLFPKPRDLPVDDITKIGTMQDPVKPDAMSDDDWDLARHTAERLLNRTDMVDEAATTRVITTTVTSLQRRFNALDTTVASDLVRVSLVRVRAKQLETVATVREDHNSRFALRYEGPKVPIRWSAAITPVACVIAGAAAMSAAALLHGGLAIVVCSHLGPLVLGFGISSLCWQAVRLSLQYFWVSHLGLMVREYHEPTTNW